MVVCKNVTNCEQERAITKDDNSINIFQYVMMGKGLGVYNNALAMEELGKGRKVNWIER